MTVQAQTPPIAVDLDGYYRIFDLELAHEAFMNPHVVAAKALVPTTPLIYGRPDNPGPADIYAAIMETPAGKQAQRSLLATTGDRHEHLGGPVEEALRSWSMRPDFPPRVEGLAEGFADAMAALPQPVDLAEHIHAVPARIACDLFGFTTDPTTLRRLARLQTGLIWDREKTRQEQMAGLSAVGQLQGICAATVSAHIQAWHDGHRIDDVTTRLWEVLRDENDTLGLDYGVGIAAVEGTGWSVLNVICQMLGRGDWGELGTAPNWRVAYRMALPAFRADPGIHSVLRTTDAPVVIGEWKIPEGATIAIDLTAIGDPFGGADNEHWCTGAPVGRIELATIPWVLARRFPDATAVPDQTMTRVNSRFFNGYRHLLVDFTGE